MVWNRISTDFDPEEETANFGTRHAFESKNNLFDVVTVATISGSSDFPEGILSYSGSEGLAFGLDSCLHILLGEEGIDPHSFELNEDLSFLLPSPCQRFILSGSSHGNIRLFHLEKKMFLPPFSLSSATLPFIGGHFRENEFLVLDSSSSYISIRGLNLEKIHESLSTGNLTDLKEIESSLRIEEPFPLQGHYSGITSSSFLYSENSLADPSLLYDGLEKLVEFENVQISCVRTSEIRKDLLFLLDAISGDIFAVCSLTLIILRVFKCEPIKDFVLLEENSQNGDNLKFICLTKNESLQIREFPSFEIVYGLKVNSYCRLIETHLNLEAPFFIEGNNQESKLSLRLRSIVEASPEARLSRLLRRNKFDEAFLFIKNFRLDPDEIYRAKTNWLLECLSPWKSSRLEDDYKDNLLKELKRCLTEVKDKDFVVQTCIKAALPTIHDTKNLLIFAREMIQANLEQLSIDLLIVVSQVLQKIETFRLIDGTEVDDWISFIDKRFYDVMLSYLKKNQVSRAKVIWIRHQAEFTTFFDSESVSEILAELADFTEVDVLEWCKDFIPDSLKLVPESLPVIASWAHDVVRSMESRRNKGWPSCGLSFAQKVIKHMTFSEDNGEQNSRSQLILFQQRSKSSSPLHRLIDLANVLKDLVILHDTFRLKIKLEDFLDSNVNKVVAILLDWTSPEEMPCVVENFLNDYLNRRTNEGFKISEVYETYLIDLIENTSVTWHWKAGSAPWEEKVQSLIPYISSSDRKANVILKAVQAAPVPWSKVISDLCSIGSLLPDPSMSFAIKEQETLVSLKQILKRYQCRIHDVSNKLQATKIIKMVIKKSKGSSEGFKDILEIASVTPHIDENDATLEYILYLLQNDPEGPPKRATDLVVNENRTFICRRILSFAVVSKKYSKSEDDAKVLKNCISFLGSVIDESVPIPVREEYEYLKKKSMLLGECGDNPATLFSQIKSDVENKNENFNVHNLFTRYQRLGYLMGVNEQEVATSLFKELLHSGNFKEIPKLVHLISRESFVISSQNLDPLIEIIVDGCAASHEGLEFYLENFEDFISSVLSYKKFDILDLCELGIWIRIISSVLCSRKNDSSYSIQTFAYKDRGLPLGIRGTKSLFSTVKILFPSDPQMTCLRYKPKCVLFQSKNSQDFKKDETFTSFANIKINVNKIDYNYLDIIEQLKKSLDSCMSVCSQNAQTLLGFIDFLSYKSALQILLALTPCKNTLDIEKFQTHLTKNLFPKILSERKKDLDTSLAFLLLLNETPSSGLSILSTTNESFKSDFSRCAVLAKVGYYYSSLMQLPSAVQKYKSYLIRVSWAKIAIEYGVSVKDAYVFSKDCEDVMLSNLVKSDKISVDKLRAYAEAFDLDTNQVLVTYAREHLLKSSEVLSPKIEEVFDSITSSSVLNDLLFRMWEEASFYNYSILDCIINRIQISGSTSAEITKAGNIIKFLRQYDRIKEPSEIERNLWLNKYKPDYRKFPEDLAKRRLPLTPLVSLSKKEKFKLLEKEFQLSNYKLWVSISDVLNFNSDNVIFKAIENAFENLVLFTGQDNDKNNSLDSNHETLLEQIYSCLSEMKNLFKATSCAYWIMSKLPRGKDKVNASRKYRLIAEKWNSEDEEKSGEALEYAIDDQLRVETEFVLMRFGLDTQMFIDLVNEKAIESLIIKLYEHESIIERSRMIGGYFPDINAAAEEISTIHGLNIVAIKYDLLTNWLPETKVISYMDDTLDLNHHSQGENAPVEKDKNNYLRCVYMSQSSNLHKYLVNFALGNGPDAGGSQTTNHRLRALKCLLSVADENSLDELTCTSFADLQELFANLLFVSRLESLGLHYDLDTYVKCDKKLLIESILRSSGITREGLSLIIDLSMSFSIYDPILWDILLNKLVNYSSPRMKFVLLELNHQPHLWHLANFLSAWEYLIFRPFRLKSDHHTCAETIQLLRKCPLNLNVSELRGECTRLGYLDLVKNL